MIAVDYDYGLSASLLSISNEYPREPRSLPKSEDRLGAIAGAVAIFVVRVSEAICKREAMTRRDRSSIGREYEGWVRKHEMHQVQYRFRAGRGVLEVKKYIAESAAIVVMLKRPERKAAEWAREQDI
jgi:hypothetical protein